MSKKPPTKLRDSWIKVRVSQDEKSGFEKKAADAGLTVAGLIRQSLTRSNIQSKHTKEVVREIARVGNNLNQIARWCNIHKNGADALEVAQHLVEIERLLDEILTR